MFVVLEAHLVLSVLAVLSNVCLWSLKRTWCCQCLLYLAMYVCAHLVLSVLAALSNVCLWSLKRTWCCQCLLHLAMYVCGPSSASGAISACCTWHMCWLYVCLWRLECTWCLSACCTSFLFCLSIFFSLDFC